MFRNLARLEIPIYPHIFQILFQVSRSQDKPFSLSDQTFIVLSKADPFLSIFNHASLLAT